MSVPWNRFKLARRWFGLLALGLCTCAGPNLWTDGTSVSVGRSNQGRIRQPNQLPKSGTGFVVPKRWRERGFQFGIDELVGALQRAAKQVHGGKSSIRLGIADLSPRRGGRSKWHHSHQSGRDTDILFYSVSASGKPLRPPEHEMIHYDEKGQAYAPNATIYSERNWQQRKFDRARNWQLIEELLSDPEIRVQWIFVSDGLKKLLISDAQRKKRPQWIINYANVVLRQPEDAPPHDDHFHVRIYCPRNDRVFGCNDRGVVWHHEKKSMKYYGPEHYDPVMKRLLTSYPIVFGQL